jgi:probable rRNA maturation factor
MRRLITVCISNNTRKYEIKKRVILANIRDILSCVETNYELDLDIAFVGKKMIQSLNNRFRNKNRPTNVLSFSDKTPAPPLKHIGEIVICPAVAEEEATRDENKFNDYVGFLLIHGILHVVGYDHNTEDKKKEMEDLEEKIFNAFNMRPFIKKGAY